MDVIPACVAAAAQSARGAQALLLRLLLDADELVDLVHTRGVLTRATVDDVADAVLRVERVGAVAADQRVLAGAAVDPVVAVGSDQAVVAGETLDHVVAAE